VLNTNSSHRRRHPAIDRNHWTNITRHMGWWAASAHWQTSLKAYQLYNNNTKLYTKFCHL